MERYINRWIDRKTDIDSSPQETSAREQQPSRELTPSVYLYLSRYICIYRERDRQI